MTAAAAIRQSDIARLMRAARRERVAVEIDMARGTATIRPQLDAPPVPRHSSALAADGEENFDAE